MIWGWNSGVMSWARDHRKSGGRCTSHLNTFSGCKLWAQYSPQAGESKGISSPVGTRGHATTVNNEIVMNLFMNLFLVT